MTRAARRWLRGEARRLRRAGYAVVEIADQLDITCRHALRLLRGMR